MIEFPLVVSLFSLKIKKKLKRREKEKKIIKKIKNEMLGVG